MRAASCDLKGTSLGILVALFMLPHLGYSDFVNCPPVKNIGDIFENDPAKKCLDRDTLIQGFLLPKGTKLLFFKSNKLMAVKVPEPGYILQGIKWTKSWIKFSEKSGKIESGVLAENKRVNGATIAANQRISIHEDGALANGKLAQPLDYRGFHIPANVEVTFYPNGNLREVSIDTEKQVVKGPKGEQYGPPGWLQFSEDGTTWNFREGE